MKNLIAVLFMLLLMTCNLPYKPKEESQTKKEEIECKEDNRKIRKHLKKVMERKIGGKLPFESVKYACIENGYAVIIDGSWCYWIDKADSIFCVNGTSKSLMHKENGDLDCVNAPISIGFSDIKNLVK